MGNLQDVEENERTVCVVIPGEVAMRKSLDPRDGCERQFGNDSTVKAVKFKCGLGLLLLLNF